jgi:formylglycine-generating enzyme required for sulfatase activity
MKQSRETVKRNSQEKQSRETVKRNSQEKQSINYVSYNSQNSFFNSSKAISPVVSTALLLVVAVVAVVGFQGWFQTFTSSTFVKVEQEGSIGSMNTLIETIVGSNLYFKNGYSNLTITDIQIDGTSCNISDSYGSGMSEIDLGNCTLNATSSTPDVVIITDKGIFSKKIYLKNIVTSSSVISNLDCSTLNGGEWSLVPGNGELGTSDFCVMNYEAKWNGSGTINNVGSAYCGSGDDYNVSTGCIDDTEGVISQANSLPLRNVNQFEAIELCSRLGSNYHLVTDAEWVTIARNIEQLDANWDSGTAYTGSLKRGNTGDVVAGVAYNAASDPADRSLDTNSLALLNLSNGEGIWDFSGNLWEWTSDTLPRSGVLNSSLGEGTGEGWAQWNTISLSYDYLKPFNTSLTSANGIGRVYYHGGLSWPNGATWDTNHGFLRGGSWLSGANAGGFALVLGYGPSLSDSTFGFRCSYAP